MTRIIEIEENEKVPVNYHRFTNTALNLEEKGRAYGLSKNCPRAAPVDGFNSDLSACYLPLKPVSRTYLLTHEND